MPSIQENVQLIVLINVTILVCKYRDSYSCRLWMRALGVDRHVRGWYLLGKLATCIVFVLLIADSNVLQWFDGCVGSRALSDKSTGNEES